MLLLAKNKRAAAGVITADTKVDKQMHSKGVASCKAGLEQHQRSSHEHSAQRAHACGGYILQVTGTECPTLMQARELHMLTQQPHYSKAQRLG